MTIPDLLLLAVALSMDAFAVAICKGLSMEKLSLPRAAAVGGWFGGFQALMPTLGYLLASLFAAYVERFVPWIACALLCLIGINMIREAFEREEEGCADGVCSPREANASLSVSVMLPLALATSIDALASGVSLVMLSPSRVLFAVVAIGVTTCLLSALGVWVGHVFGARYKARAELLGGVVLILLGRKTLLSHYGILPF